MKYEQGPGLSRESWLATGAVIRISEKDFCVERVSSARELGSDFGLHPSADIPVYWLDGYGPGLRGAYVPKANCVLFFRNTDLETVHHELVHAVEHYKEKRPGLTRLYQEALDRITEASFDDGLISFNFRKNIGEFLADGRSKPLFIAALKKEGLYDRFLEESAYLFEDGSISS